MSATLYAWPDNSSRGDVAIYLRDDIEFVERGDLSIFVPQFFEAVFVTLKPCDITIGVIYRSPLSDTQMFVRYFNEALGSLKKNSTKFILLGDFNINLLNYQDNINVTDFVY